MDDKKQTKKRKKSPNLDPGRVTYYLAPEVKEKITHLSIELGVPQSQVADALLHYALEHLEHKDIQLDTFLEKSTSPKFAHNLDIERFKTYIQQQRTS